MKKFESVGQYSLKKKWIVLQIAANLAYFVASAILKYMKEEEHCEKLMLFDFEEECAVS